MVAEDKNIILYNQILYNQIIIPHEPILIEAYYNIY